MRPFLPNDSWSFIRTCLLLIGVLLVNVEGDAQAFRVLHYTQTTGWDHGTADESLQMFQELGALHNFAVDHDADGTSFNDLATLQQYDVIVWSNTSGSYNLNATQRAHFEAYINGGGNYLGIHAASDTYRHSSANGGDTGFWDFYAEVCGGSVQQNPNHTAQNFNADLNHIGTHASLENIPNPWNKDEEYYYWENGYLSPDIQEVLRVENTGAETYDAPRPISWYKSLPGGGRSFYTAMGHDPSNYTSDQYFRNHIRDALLWVVGEANPVGDPVTLSGELKKWHTLTLTFEGLATSEDDLDNPFLNYRLDVTFTHGTHSFRVPGYFAADGDAGETSASSGNKWRVHFTPNATGTWTYEVSFRTGTNVAVADDPNAGTPVSMDGMTGSFVVGANDKAAPDLRAKGRLNYVHQHYLQFEETGEYFIKGGTNSPENFLGYAEFDNTYDNEGNGNALHTTDPFVSQGQNYAYKGDGLHHYEPHINDWQAGDPSWQDGKGKGIIGAVNYLGSEEVNALYFITMNVDGDGREVFPWTDYWVRDRFDVSKLDQWEKVFAHMEQKGIVMHVVLQEQENDQLLDGGYLGVNRKLYLRELVARFSHHLGLLWNLGEENTNTHQQRLDMAEYLYQLDPYHHFIGVHTFIGQQEDIYGKLLGYVHMDGASLQMDLQDIHLETKKWVEESAQAGRPWAVFSDEIGPFQTGVAPDGPTNNHLDIRWHALYGNLFAGGAGAEWYFGYDEDHNDLDCEDFRSRDQMWDYTRIARQFMKDHSTFLAMRSADELVDNPNAFCFAWDSVSYLVYLPNGGATNLDLGVQTRTFPVQWFNPRTGGALQNGSLPSITGPGPVSIGTPPGGGTEDWIAVIGDPTAAPPNTPPSFQLSGGITVDQDFTTTELVTVNPAPVPVDEQSQVVTYSLSPPSVSFANLSIDPATGTVQITAVPDSFGTQQFVVTANDGQAYNAVATDTFTLVVRSSVATSSAININAGGDAYAAAGGVAYDADRDFVGGNVFTTTNPIANTVDDVLYQTERTAAGGFGYVLPVPNGNYTVRLHFAEIFHTQVGQRVMDVSLEGTPVLTDFDLVAEAGSFTALVREFQVQIADGAVELDFSASVDQPKVSAIQLLVDSGPPPPNTPPTFSLDRTDIQVDEDFTTVENIVLTPDPVPAGEEGQTVTYALSPSSVPFADIIFDPATGNVSIAAVPNGVGSQTFTITADDGQATDNLATQSFSLTVNPVNDAPAFTTSGDWDLNEDFVGTQLVVIFPGDVPSDETDQVVTYSLSPATVDFVNLTFDPNSGQLSVSAVPGASGEQQFTLTADDGQGQNHLYSQTFWIRVNAVNDAPTFSLSGDVTVEENFSIPQTVTVSPDPVPADETGQTVFYSLAPGTVPFANVSIDPLTGTVTISALPNANGSQTFTITANDGQLQNNFASATFTLTVNAINQAPTFTVSGDLNLEEDFTGTQEATVVPDPVPADEQGQTVTYNLSPPTVDFAEVAIDPFTGAVTITSLPDAHGSQEFTITANDGQGSNATATDNFQLLVLPVNDAPSFSLSGDINVDQDFTTTETVTVMPDPVPADEQGQTVTYSLSPATVAFANISIDPNTGEVSITSVPGQSGSQVFTLTADDGQAENNLFSQTFRLTVNLTNNTPPTFTVNDDLSLEEDFTGTFSVGVTPDPVPAPEAGQAVTYSLAPASVGFANVSIDPNTGLVSVSAVPDSNGSQVFTITADDGQSHDNLATATFTLTVNPVNDPPAFTYSGDVIATEDFVGARTMTITPFDPPQDETSQVVTYRLLPATVDFANVSIDPNTGNVTITSVPDGVGSQFFTVEADDGQGINNTATINFLLIINQENDPPTFSLSGDVVVDENFPGTETVVVTPDPVKPGEETQTVVYALDPPTVNFANVSIDPATGNVSISAVPNFFGSQTFTIYANDGEFTNNVASQTFTLTVNQTENTAPTFSLSGDITVPEDFATTEVVSLTPDPVPADEADEVVAYSLSPETVPFANVSFDSLTGQVSITSVPGANGSQEFTITADDGAATNNTATGTFMLTVEAVNNPPVFALNGSGITEDEDFQGTRQLSLTPDPVPADEADQVVTYRLAPATVPFATLSIDPATGTVSVSAIPDSSGTQLITVIADDGGAANATHSEPFTLTINPRNDAPTFSMTGNITLPEDFAPPQTVEVVPDPVPWDEQGQVVTYQISPTTVDFANITFDPGTGTVLLAAVPNAAGSRTFTITADDGQSSDNLAFATFTLTVTPVNDPPTFTTTGDLNLLEDFPGTEQVQVIPDPIPSGEAGQSVSYSLSPATVDFANVSFDPQAGTVSVSSVPNASGSQLFTLTANDGQATNATATATFTLNVSPVNDPPLFSLSGDVVVDEDFTTTEIVTVTPSPPTPGEEGQVISYRLSPAAIDFANVSIDPATGEVTITSVPHGNGTQVFTLIADDGQANNALSTATFTLRVNPINDDPAFVLSGDVAVEEDFPGTETVTVSPGPVPQNEQSQEVTYTLSPASVDFANVSIDPATGKVSISAVPNGSGTQVFAITANDGQAANNTYQASFTLTVGAVNDAPSFGLSGDVTVDENFPGTEVVSLTPDPVPADEQGQNVTYTLLPATVDFATIRFDPATGTVRITAVPDASGSQTFTLTADDGQSENNLWTERFTLTVNAVNNPPTFSVSGDITVQEDFTSTEVVTLTPDAVPTDEQGQTVTYSLLPASVDFANVTIDPATGTVSITSIADASGSQTFTLIADDGQAENSSWTETFTLTVSPVNDLPAFVLSGDLTLDENFEGTEQVTVTPGPVPTDEQSQPLTYSLSPATVDFANVLMDPATGTVSVTAVPNASGTQTFTVTANDGQASNGTFSQTFTLTILPINNPPRFVLSGDIEVNENFTTTEQVGVSPDPVPADEQDQEVVYTLSPATVDFANIAFDPNTGQVIITAVPDASGTQAFTITANDGQSENNLWIETFTLTVNAVNNPPSFALGVNELLLQEDFSPAQLVSLTPDPVPANEAAQAVTYRLEPASAEFVDIQIDPEGGEITLTALPDRFGAQAFVVVADDGQAENNLATDTLRVEVQAVNDPPAFSLSATELELEEDFEGVAVLTVSPEPVPEDEATQTVTYALTPASVDFVTIDFDPQTGNVGFTAVPDAWGTQEFTLLANDGASEFATDTVTFTLSVLSENDPPSFSITGDLSLPFNFDDTAVVQVIPDAVPADEVDQTVTYTLEPPNVSFANIDFDPQTGEIIITAVPDSFGTQTFLIIANDGQSESASDTTLFTLEVDEPEPTSLRINAGGDRDMAFGPYLFVADTFFVGGDVFYNSDIKDMLNTSWDELYRSERAAPTGVNSFLYDIPLYDGEYVLFLHFAETYWGAFGGGCCGNIGERVFNVEVNEVPELVNFDMLAETGPMSALVKEIPVLIEGGRLLLKFDGIKDRPIIKAIEILALQDTATAISNIDNPNNPLVDPIYDFGGELDSGETNMLIYPNPVPDDVTVLVENEMEGTLEVFIYDNFGKRYKAFTVEKKERFATYTFPVEDLIPGYYVIHFLDANTGLSVARKFWKVE